MGLWGPGSPCVPSGSRHSRPSERASRDRRTQRPERGSGRSPSVQPVPSPPGPSTHRPGGGGRIPASPQRPGLGRARPAGGRQLHAAASFSSSLARPVPAPPAHFPQEMINSGRGVLPWQPAPTPAGDGACSVTRTREPRHSRVPAHAGARVSLVAQACTPTHVLLLSLNDLLLRSCRRTSRCRSDNAHPGNCHSGANPRQVVHTECSLTLVYQRETQN